MTPRIASLPFILGIATLPVMLLTACVPGDDATAPASSTSPFVDSSPRNSNAAPSGEEATTALIDAVRNDDAPAATAALDNGADIEVVVDNEMTPLVMATKSQQTELALVLIEAGADVNAKDDMEDSAFLYAGAEGLNEILKATLAAGADVKSVNRYGGTALIPASEHGHIETIELLIAADVPVDHVNRLGWTALHEAIVLGDGGRRQQQTVKLLLEAGADAALTDGNGVTPRQLAAERGYNEIVALLDRHL